MPSRSRRSSAIRLVLMGAAVGGGGLLAGCGTDVQRNRYNSLADCVADYSEAQCTRDVPIGTAAAVGAAAYYYGPWYRSSSTARLRDTSDAGPGRYFSTSTSRSPAARPAGVETGTRGGFGAHGRVSASGG